MCSLSLKISLFSFQKGFAKTGEFRPSKAGPCLKGVEQFEQFKTSIFFCIILLEKVLEILLENDFLLLQI